MKSKRNSEKVAAGVQARNGGSNLKKYVHLKHIRSRVGRL